MADPQLLAVFWASPSVEERGAHHESLSPGSAFCNPLVKAVCRVQHRCGAYPRAGYWRQHRNLHHHELGCAEATSLHEPRPARTDLGRVQVQRSTAPRTGREPDQCLGSEFRGLADPEPDLLADGALRLRPSKYCL